MYTVNYNVNFAASSILQQLMLWPHNYDTAMKQLSVSQVCGCLQYNVAIQPWYNCGRAVVSSLAYYGTCLNSLKLFMRKSCCNQFHLQELVAYMCGYSDVSWQHGEIVFCYSDIATLISL